jgi:cytochrome c
MDSFENNKLAGAFLGVVFFVMSLGLVTEALFHDEKVETPGFAIAAAEPAAESGAEGSAPAEIAPISPLLASADLAAGEAVFKKCAACHSWEEGGANKTGPNLWNLINRPVASHEGFAYSAAMREHVSVDPVWTYESLNKFLHGPKKYVSGTAMGFAGLKKDTDIANLLAWMRTHSPSPAPLP